MSDPMKQAWSDVADGFTKLGELMKERYQSAGTDDQEAGEASSAGTALRDAFDHLVAAGRELGDRATDVARDDEVKAQAKRAATSLNDALSATVDLIGDEVGALFKRPKSAERSESEPSKPSEIVPPPPTSDDAAP
jgi:hypothetical protein